MADLRLYILCGLPFAGKSTLARAMAERLDLSIVEVDRFHRERGLPRAGQRLTRREWTAAYRESYARLDALLAADRSVVYDATNFRRRMRDRLRRIAAGHGASTIVVPVAPPEAEIRSRRERNRVTRRRAHVPDEDFAEVSEGFQPPTPDENVVPFDASVPLDRWLDRLPRA